MEEYKNKLSNKETNHTVEDHISETVIERAKDCVPSNSTPNKRNRPWFNKKCQKAYRIAKSCSKEVSNEANQLQSDRV